MKNMEVSTGTVEQWNSETMKQWNNGTMEQWIYFPK